ncbi:hypothetical protein CNBJ0310 [Cryptococcus deneoformans B-3501A]|uniref:Uncharacterized protein n=1 Tax=Cryptococcus deneoformans (strain JEC21 / ATCC MYA-565) TaxID=214684 RepID=A0A0S2LJ56_CRYD1|nr:hypothetical protein CNJ03177 [Cryptococcus neoformans var. neoformans JEC21]XP_773253.1 hypothetical protein CNBJ0310 [Cryptococcus neoformans var. neoformans B-3501A]ALO60931.1 hypothetical protein CNJ03177 [Cryptococcus neoformans var. neoformans JEC21]EAL18606.1 hypothetical protein CNBJ0310 [Cryptococcus neoformans var. neoformans B-3501A]
MSPNQVQQPTTASSSDPRGLPMANELPKTTSATFGITRRQEGHPPPYHASPSREDVPETMLVMSTTKQWVCLLAIDLFFFLLPFFFSLAWYLTDTKPLKSVAMVVSLLVFSIWSFLRWPEVFSDLSQDAVTKYSASQQWSLLGRRYGWSRAMDARLRRAVRRTSQMCIGGIVVIQFWWLLMLGMERAFIGKILGMV